MQGYRISTNKTDMDVKLIHDFISHSYWAKGIPLDTLMRAIENSLCFAVLTEQGEQIGFARMITDSATYAYLSDVFVIESHRGKGLSKWLMEIIMAHPALQGLRRMMLATRDAHGLYEQFGFKSLASPQNFMEAWNPNVYSQS